MDPNVHYYVAPSPLALVASGVAVVGGMTAQVMPPANTTIGTAGLIVATAGLVTAIGAVLVPIVKILSELRLATINQRMAETRSAEERHELAGKLQLAQLEIRELQDKNEILDRAQLVNRDWIDLMLRRDPTILPPPAISAALRGGPDGEPND